MLKKRHTTTDIDAGTPAKLYTTTLVKNLQQTTFLVCFLDKFYVFVFD